MNCLASNIGADILGKKVITGSNESTSLGCLAAQLPQQEAGISISEIRGVLRNSIATKEFEPQQDLTALAAKYIGMFAGKGE